MVIKGMKPTQRKHSIADEFKHVKINDYRIVKRLKNTAGLLEKSPESSIPKACQNIAQVKAVYRLLDNSKLKHNMIMDSHRKETIKRMKGLDKVLVLQDSSELNFTTHIKTKGLGPIGTTKNLLGLIMHSALCVTTNGVPLGLLAQRIWARNFNERGKSSFRRKLPIEEKESYKWLEIMDLSLISLPKNITAVTVADREADIYELFHKAVQDNRELLIRATHDRRVAQEQERLYQQIHNSPITGECIIQVPRNSKLNVAERNAKLMIKICQVTLRPPLNGIKRNLANVNLYAIYAEETFPPEGFNPVQWLLLTTLPVTDFEQAMEKIHWYCHRWKIERFHFTLKSGCEIEDLQLETSDRLKNAISLYSVLAWKLTWITYQSRETPDAPCSLILEEHEWKVLCCLVNKTSRPPKKPPTLQEAVVLIARLGGFLARKSDGNPGIKTLWLGYRQFYNSIETLSILNLSPFS